MVIEARGQDLWQEELLSQDWEKQLVIYFGVGGSKDKRKFQKNFHRLKKTHRIPEVWLLSSKELTLRELGAGCLGGSVS